MKNIYLTQHWRTGGEPASLGLKVILQMKKETMLGEQQNGTDKDSKKRKTSRKKNPGNPPQGTITYPLDIFHISRLEPMCIKL